MDNIKLEKIWQDDDLFEISIICQNEKITASTEVYVTNSIIEELQREIDKLLQHEKSEIFWASGERGNTSTACVEIRAFTKDLCGHITIECFMELNDGGKLDTHHCCFFVNTEFGMLYNFNSNLDILKESKLGVCVSLNN